MSMVTLGDPKACHGIGLVPLLVCGLGWFLDVRKPLLVIRLLLVEKLSPLVSWGSAFGWQDYMGRGRWPRSFCIDCAHGSCAT